MSNPVTKRKYAPMKYRGSILVLAIMVVVGSAIVPTYAQSENKAQSIRIPFEGQFDALDCAGELIQFSGFLHITFQEISKNDGTFHQISIVNFQDITGIGLNTGFKYIIPDAGFSVVNDNINPGFTTTTEGTFHFIVLGPEHGFGTFAHTTIHFTVNANGEVTVDDAKVTFECK